MILGKVSALGSQNGIVRLEAQIEIAIASADRIFHTETVAIDTGFTGWLALPQTSIDRMGLTFYGRPWRRRTIQQDIAAGID